MPKSNGGLPEGGLQVRTYFDCLRAAWEVEKGDSMELHRSPRAQTTNNAPKLQDTSFFPLWKLKGNQPTSKTPASAFWYIWRNRMLGETRTKSPRILMPQKLTVRQQHGKLFGELDLSGLDSWPPRDGTCCPSALG